MGGLIVLDASAALETVLQTAVGARLEARLAKGSTLVPAHFDAELLSALRRLARARRLAPWHAALAVVLVARLPFDRVPLAPLLVDAFAMRDRCSAGDALYVVLAHRLDATLITTDGPLTRAARGLAKIELVSL